MKIHTKTMESEKVTTTTMMEADRLSKETGINFRDCLELVYKASSLEDGLQDTEGERPLDERRF